MTRINLRRAASITVAALYVVAFATFGTPWFLVASLGIIALELWIQRVTEIGWRFFRANLDERQEELQNRILAISYRAVIGFVLVIMVFLAGFGSNMSAAGRLAIPGEFTALIMRSTSLILVVLFLLPGHVSAWLEPVAEEKRSKSLGAER